MAGPFLAVAELVDTMAQIMPKNSSVLTDLFGPPFHLATIHRLAGLAMAAVESAEPQS
jgi:hypothetical protein